MYKSVGADEFYQKVKTEELIILDVREMDEFESGHISVAQTMPLSGLEEQLDKLDQGSEYYVICHSGGRSAMACEYLSNQGYQVVNVLGGMSSWKGEIV